MNEALKKTPKIDYSARYMERHQTLCVTLDKESDADIINWLQAQQNRSVAVRRALREVIANGSA